MANNTARLYRIELLIRTQGQVTFQQLLDELQVSPATLKRDLEYLRSRLGAPILYDAGLRAYRFAQGYAGSKHELPGLWFNETELYSLLTAQQVLASVDSEGLLSRHLQPLLDRIEQLLAGGAGGANPGHKPGDQLAQRVKIVTALRRPVPSQFFERVTAALLQRRRLQLLYFTRGRGETSEREVSPQRLVHYRGTWYLDAWCHKAQGLRRFAVDAMEQATVLDVAAQDVPLAQVAKGMDAGYGIYAGGKRQWAILLFNAMAAQWASREEWHPEQKTQWHADGQFEMQLPYVDDNELLMDLLRQGDQVRVLAPAALVQAVRSRLLAAAALYG
jgi:predicted DNA-binding transcriptional regulator YafY